MKTEPDPQHIADVRMLSRGYVAACSTCDWVGPERRHPDLAVEDARTHEKSPMAAEKVPDIRLRKIRRRL
jgi:hypothetical protein